MNPDIVLATSSPHRKKMLRKMGIPFQAHAPDVDERELGRAFSGSLKNLSGHLALKKAESLKTLFPDRIIVGSDQVLVFNKRSFSKPESREEVIQRLQLLRGKTHFLSTSISIIRNGGSRPVCQKTVISGMTMHPLSEDEIISYVEADNPLGCVGGYLFEKRGALLFKEVRTRDPHSIVGFPLLTLVDWLRRNGVMSMGPSGGSPGYSRGSGQ